MGSSDQGEATPKKAAWGGREAGGTFRGETSEEARAGAATSRRTDGWTDARLTEPFPQNDVPPPAGLRYCSADTIIIALASRFPTPKVWIEIPAASSRNIKSASGFELRAKGGGEGGFL